MFIGTEIILCVSGVNVERSEVVFPCLCVFWGSEINGNKTHTVASVKVATLSMILRTFYFVQPDDEFPAFYFPPKKSIKLYHYVPLAPDWSGGILHINDHHSTKDVIVRPMEPSCRPLVLFTHRPQVVLPQSVGPFVLTELAC